VTDAERIAELENEVLFLRSELALIESEDDRSRMARVLRLTGQESRVLAMLFQAKGRVLSAGQIDDRLRQCYARDREPGTKTVLVHVCRIRKAVGYDVIQTVNGAGYCVPARERLRIAAWLAAEERA
jgi:DNA-binding response OmpR family regulator